MDLKEKADLAIKQGKLEGAKKLLTAYFQQEDKKAWLEEKRKEYETIFPTYREITDEEKREVYTEYLTKCEEQGIKDVIPFEEYEFEQVFIEYITVDEEGNEVRNPSDYLTFNEWLNETVIVQPEVQEESHIDENGEKVIDVPFQPEIKKLVRPYTPSDVTDKISEYLKPVFREKWKKEREKQVDNIVVTTSVGDWDGDELAQTRMARAILAMSDTDTVSWVLADNTMAEVTKEQLKEALKLAGESQTKIWLQQPK